MTHVVLPYEKPRQLQLVIGWHEAREFLEPVMDAN